LLALSVANQAQLGVHFPSVVEQVVFHWQLLIKVTFRAFEALKVELIGVPHALELLRLQIKTYD